MSWGVTPIMTEVKSTSDELFEHAVNCAVRETKLVKKGDVVVLTGGSPLGISGTTNILKSSVGWGYTSVRTKSFK